MAKSSLRIEKIKSSVVCGDMENTIIGLNLFDPGNSDGSHHLEIELGPRIDNGFIQKTLIYNIRQTDLLKISLMFADAAVEMGE